MDVQATAPPEIVQAEMQPSVDALRRLLAAREALVQLFEAQPKLTEADGQAVRQLIAALRDFWAAPGTSGNDTRSDTLGHLLAAVMKEEATLRRRDGTLSDEAAALAARAVASEPMPTGIHLRELMLAEAAHAGSLIVVDDNTPDLALLFTTHGGWEAFDSLERLLDTTRRRLLESVDTADGTGLDNDRFAEAKATGGVGSREITGPLFTTMARRMIDVQSDRIALAADDYSLDNADPDAAKHLGDRVRYELAPAVMLDVDTIDRLREARLIEATLASRLAKVPGTVRAAWYEARDTYNDALASAATLRMATGTQPLPTLREFASRELSARLESLGIDEAPEAITIEAARVKVLPEPLEFLDPLPGSTTARQVPLIDFACQNIGRFSLDMLRAVDAQGAPLGNALGHAVIRDMVRDLDLANRYQAHVDERLRTGSAGALARKLAMVVQAAQMRLEAAEARLSYYLPGEPRSFIDDRDERGFHWVEAVLDNASGERRVDGHSIAVSQLTYQQAPVDGILVFAARAPASAPRMVMYTPGAPDGLTFREFESRQDAAKHFLYHPAFREYLLDRLPAEFATVSSNGVTRKFAGDRLAHWVLGTSGDTAYTLTAEPFEEREVRGDVFAVAHDTTVERYRRDARFLGRSTADADGDAWFGHVQDRLSKGMGSHLVTTALTDVPASLGRMMEASWRFYDHVKAGDTGQAFLAFTDGYVSALAVVVPPYVGGRAISAAIVGSHAAARGVATTNIRLAPPRVRFDDRYAAKGVRQPGKPDQDGILRAPGQAYIKQDGTLYLVRHDADYSLWRLVPRRGPSDPRFTGPLIERVDGRWVHANAGLRGGMRRIRDRLNRLAVRNDALPPVADAPIGLPLPDAPMPDAPRPMILPAVMEPMRAEITAALADNPSASAMVRTDGTHLKILVPPRSALIVDPHLHPDLAALSAHQRRVFLHELDTRFPLHAERAEVLNARGWSQRNGRRLPSPPSSPGGVHDLDIQSPDISSSGGGEPLSPLPALTPHQQARWDEALATARNTPRVRPRSSALPASSMETQTLQATELVPADEWPSHVWYFSERNFQVETWPGYQRRGITLGASPWLDAAEGIRTYPVSVLPPETPAARLAEALGTSPIQQGALRDPLAYALHFDLGRFREPWQPAGRNHFVRTPDVDFELRRRRLPNGEFQYELQSSRPVRIPSTHIVNVGRRGERPSPLVNLRR